jgi:hypothetical protein
LEGKEEGLELCVGETLRLKDIEDFFIFIVLVVIEFVKLLLLFYSTCLFGDRLLWFEQPF